MDEKFQTSQQKAGEHSRPEGKGDISGVIDAHGSEDAPRGVSTQEALANPFKTTSNILNDLSTPESD